MAAHHYLQGEQLSMFMPAHALMDYSSAESRHPRGSSPRGSSLNVDTELHDEKLKESQVSGLLEKIRDDGVKEPVNVLIRKHETTWETYHQLWNGHHRVVSANNVNPNMEVPVWHYSAQHPAN